MTNDPLFREHTRYFYNGVEVPPCTVIAGYGPQPWLAKWAWWQGRQNIPLEAKLHWAGNIGTITHLLMKAYILGGSPPDLSYYRKADVKKAEKLAERLMDMIDKVERVIRAEVPCSCKNYGGTPDAIVVVDGKTVLIDFKTGRGIYTEAFLQVAAYRAMLQGPHMIMSDDSGEWIPSKGIKIDRVLILHAPNSGGVASKVEVSDNILHLAYKAFLARLASYKADAKLKEVI